MFDILQSRKVSYTQTHIHTSLFVLQEKLNYCTRLVKHHLQENSSLESSQHIIEIVTKMKYSSVVLQSFLDISTFPFPVQSVSYHTVSRLDHPVPLSNLPHLTSRGFALPCVRNLDPFLHLPSRLATYHRRSGSPKFRFLYCRSRT